MGSKLDLHYLDWVTFGRGVGNLFYLVLITSGLKWANDEPEYYRQITIFRGLPKD